MPVYFPGDGSRGQIDKMRNVLGKRFRPVPGFLKFHRAGIMADIAFEQYEPDKAYDFIKPFYLRKSQAERLFDEKKV
jgi:hypothetical protein